MDMFMLNERFIIKEDKMDECCEKIRGLLQDKLDSIGLGRVIAQVAFEVLCEDAGDDKCYSELIISLYEPNNDGPMGYMLYDAEGCTPTLVYQDGQFCFYYILEHAGVTYSCLEHLINTDFCPCEKPVATVEDILVQTLRDALEQ